ncbi:hypothetical protein ACH5RR_027433 [Cinchona calisaya]|uniref:Coatomer alpha subunit n=1 Tax=Cinchona calisaya TaxID=153742 RepID=A0ABD2Z5H1_9GENT
MIEKKGDQVKLKHRKGKKGAMPPSTKMIEKKKRMVSSRKKAEKPWTLVVENTESEVLGLSFHKKRPWLLLGLGNGVIQLWDYYMRSIIHCYEDHRNTAAVRSVNFHHHQPFFASGGDDCKIKIWSYEYGRCLFSLLGHLDRIRTVQFHHELPWIVSASDDRTAKIWNWQSRTCILVCSSHEDSVTSAFFHPNKDLLMSTSLDNNVRVWDISYLTPRKTGSLGDMHTFGGRHGMNWAAFHPTRPLLFFAANDHKIHICTIEGSNSGWMPSLMKHEKEVSCVLFHSFRKKDYIISSSEDKTYRVWDANKQICKFNFCLRGRDKPLILSSHPEMNFLAVGHENGFLVMKLDRARPAFSVSGNSLLYLKDDFLHVYNYSTQKDIQLIPYHRPCPDHSNEVSPSLSYSPTEDAALICSDRVGDSYELYIAPKDRCGRGDINVREAVKSGIGGLAVFVAPNMFVVLEKSSNQLLIKNLKNEIVNEGVLPIEIADAYAVFYAGNGTLLCRAAKNRVFIFHLERWLVLADRQVNCAKHIVWSNDFERVAFYTKHYVCITNKRLVCLISFYERSNVKGGAWNDDGVFIYSTLTHIKYCLPDGETGIIKTLDFPIYITKICGNRIFCFDRQGRIQPIIVNSTEYTFKLFVIRKKFDQVMSMIRTSEFCGKAMVAYLLQKGFPEVALHFVKEKLTRFDSAHESQNTEIAVDSAKEIVGINDWYRLEKEALLRGNTGILECAYQCTKNVGKLSFLYLITGNLGKLSKMMQITEAKNDVMAQFHNALCLGDIHERVAILANAGHLPLAYITASVHGIHDVAELLAAELGDNVPSFPKRKSASLLIPPKPILCGGDWPFLDGRKRNI